MSVKVTAYLIVAGECNIAHDSETADDSIIGRVIASSIINDESRFIGTCPNGTTKLYATSHEQTDDECWVLAIGDKLSHEDIKSLCKSNQHIIWKPRSLMERIEDWFDSDRHDGQVDPMIIKGNKSVI